MISLRSPQQPRIHCVDRLAHNSERSVCLCFHLCLVWEESWESCQVLVIRKYLRFTLLAIFKHTLHKEPFLWLLKLFVYLFACVCMFAWIYVYTYTKHLLVIQGVQVSTLALRLTQWWSENWAWVLYQSRKYSYWLSNFSSPKNHVFKKMFS